MRRFDPTSEEKKELARLSHPLKSDIISIQEVKRKDNDMTSIDIRWMYQKEDGEYGFTQKGLRIPVGMLDEVVDVLSNYLGK